MLSLKYPIRTNQERLGMRVRASAVRFVHMRPSILMDLISPHATIYKVHWQSKKVWQPLRCNKLKSSKSSLANGHAWKVETRASICRLKEQLALIKETTVNAQQLKDEIT
jgi:hypothetical protein